MAFWTDATQIDPKRAYHWRLSIGAPQFGDSYIFYAKEVTKPKFTMTEAVVPYLNYTYKFPGRITWEPVTVKLHNLAEPDTAAAVGQLLEAAGYIIPGSPNSTTTISKKDSVAALGHVTLEQITNPDNVGVQNGRSLETWILKNAWIKDVTFSDLNYDSDEMSMVDIVFQYDWAELIGADNTAYFTPSNL